MWGNDPKEVYLFNFNFYIDSILGLYVFFTVDKSWSAFPVFYATLVYN